MSDRIYTKCLYECRFVLSYPILHLFKLSLNSGIFLYFWKTTFVTSIHKKGNSCSIKNYRPISKMSILPKIFSKIIKITPIQNKLLADQQHGFRKIVQQLSI